MTTSTIARIAQFGEISQHFPNACLTGDEHWCWHKHKVNNKTLLVDALTVFISIFRFSRYSHLVEATNRKHICQQSCVL